MTDLATIPAPTPPIHVCMDEAWYFLHGPREQLKEAVRKFPGVPNASYVVKDGLVFVFDKLLRLVDQNPAIAGSGSSLVPAGVLNLMEQAWVSPNEAVQQWAVVPHPYKQVALKDHPGWEIRHERFHALVPGVFPAQEDVAKAFEALLVGDVVAGEGEFIYRGQPLTLISPIDCGSLPPRPEIKVIPDPCAYVYKGLAGATFLAGLPPLTKEVFDQIKELESSFRDERSSAMDHARLNFSALWVKVVDIPLHLLADTADDLDDDAQGEAAELRSLYPELAMLTNTALHSWYDTYQMECNHVNSWFASRDNDFLAFLLGILASSEPDGGGDSSVGLMVAFALLQGETITEALAFGRRCGDYSKALYALTSRVRDALHFMAEEQDSKRLRGPKIYTMMDAFRTARSDSFHFTFNAGGAVVTPTEQP